MKNKLFLNSFYLKIIAMAIIFIDHFGFFFAGSMTEQAYLVLRMIGRLGFPLYAFFIVEALYHTRNSTRYILRIFYLSILVLAFQMVVFFSPLKELFGSLEGSFNIFTTLVIGAMTIDYFKKKQYRKIYKLLPLVFSIGINIWVQFDHPDWLIFFRNDYGLYGILLIIGFYLARILTKPVLESISRQNNIDYLSFHNEVIERQTINLLSSIILLFIHLVWYILSVTTSFMPEIGIQAYALIAGGFILVYNGSQGYHSAGFKWFYYLFYPGHLVLLAVISMLTMLVK